MRVPERFMVGIERIDPAGADAGALDEFQSALFPEDGRQLHPGSRRWLAANPHAGDDGPAFWVCRRDGAIVGQQTEMPVRLKIGDRERTAGWAIDLMVDSRWRLRGVGPGLVATVLAHRSIVGVLYASKEGYPAFSKAGCVDLGSMPRYRRPLDAARLVDHPRFPARLRPAAPALTSVLRAADKGAVLAGRLAGVRLDAVDRFDDRVDQVWDHVADAYPVLMRRDLDSVRWRIDERPDTHQLRRFLLLRGGHPIGYAVVRPSGSSERIAVVVDYLARPAWVAPLLVAVGQAARDDGAIALSVRTRNPQADRALRAAGFVRSTPTGEERPIHHMVHCTDDDDTVRALVTQPDSWFLTAADGDVESALPVPTAEAAAGATA